MLGLLELKRYSTSPESTLGILSKNGTFFCHTLEDTKRPIKIDGETRIRDGFYPLDLRTGSPTSTRYKKKYSWHRWGMIWVRDVFNFKWVYLHPGNTSEDTRGCPLVGDGVNNNTTAEGRLSVSVVPYRRLYEEIAPILAKNPREIWFRVSNMG